jgi:hypothetical protein
MKKKQKMTRRFPPAIEAEAVRLSAAAAAAPPLIGFPRPEFLDAGAEPAASRFVKQPGAAA